MIKLTKQDILDFLNTELDKKAIARATTTLPEQKKPTKTPKAKLKSEKKL